MQKSGLSAYQTAYKFPYRSTSSHNQVCEKGTIGTVLKKIKSIKEKRLNRDDLISLNPKQPGRE